MSIVGSGIDLVETKRIAESLHRFGDRFLQRVFTPGEVTYARTMKFPQKHLAARFAAKEAVSKAFGTGIGREIGWREVEIIRAEGGAPRVQLHGRAEALAHKLGVRKVHLSLSHSEEYGVASAILES